MQVDTLMQHSDTDVKGRSKVVGLALACCHKPRNKFCSNLDKTRGFCFDSYFAGALFVLEQVQRPRCVILLRVSFAAGIVS